MLNFGIGSLSSLGEDTVRIYDSSTEEPSTTPFNQNIASNVFLNSVSGASTASEIYTTLGGIPSSSTLAKIRHSESGKIATLFRNLYQGNSKIALTFLTSLYNNGQLSAVDATTWLFPYLAEKDGATLDRVYFALLELCEPKTIAELAIKSHKSARSDKFFVLAISILSDLKARSLEAFDYLVEHVTGRELEQFYSAILNSASFDDSQKKKWLGQLAKNSNFKVKEHLVENLDLIPNKDLKIFILLILSQDQNSKIKHTATEALKNLKS